MARRSLKQDSRQPRQVVNDATAGIAAGGSLITAGLTAWLALAGQIVAIVAGVVSITAAIYAIRYYRKHLKKP